MNVVLKIMKYHAGAANPISRSDLAMQAVMSDRSVRNTIRDLRKEGVPIVSTSDSRGYFMGETPEEINRVIAEFRSRGQDCLDTAKALEDRLAQKAQMSFEADGMFTTSLQTGGYHRPTVTRR